MHLFDQDITFEQTATMVFEGTTSDNWSINGTPNGGYLMAVLARAMGQLTEKHATPILTANYLSRCTPDPARVVVEKLAESSQFSRFRASLFQQEKEKISAIGTFSNGNGTAAVTRYEKRPPEMLPVDACTAIPELPGYTVYRHLDLRLDPACAGWMTGGELSERSEQKGWARFKDRRPADPEALFLMADAFPPAVLASQGLTAWVPTLEFSVNIRNLPATPWLKCVFRTRFINHGLVEEDGEIWDEEGGLVAISRQIAQFKKG
ncbi:MAG: thioesterase family protein [Desulfobacterales bacterium]|nr:thioesterase family protein [Desulfobacterales bacterium]